jgi:site-specific recombinase XerD
MQTLKANLKVSFYLKKNVSRNGLCPVMGRITIDKDMVQFSCKLAADPLLWDTRAGRMNGKSNRAMAINGEIDRINVAVNAKYREILSVKGRATADEVKNSFQGIASSQETLLKLFREHNDEYGKRVGVNTAKSTFENYRNACTRLERFIKHKYHVSDLPFGQLDYSFIENYDYYLRINCRMMPNTVLNKMICLKKMVRIAVGRGIISRDPFIGYCAERPEACQRFVPSEELERLMKIQPGKPNLAFTRDMFVFSCFTGLAYVDLYNLTCEQVVTADDGSLWLNITRQKTGSVSKIPLLKVPLQIIEKYKGTAAGNRVFPVKSLCSMNGLLKKISALCGIERVLTFHMARHTFATETCLSQGVPIETVSRMMGHHKLSTTQIYAKVTHNKVDEDMKALSERIRGKYVLAS